MTSEFLALVYIAALALDQGETIAQVFIATSPVRKHELARAPDEHGFVWMSEDGFRNAFAQHATAEQIAGSAAVQRTEIGRGSRTLSLDKAFEKFVPPPKRLV